MVKAARGDCATIARRFSPDMLTSRRRHSATRGRARLAIRRRKLHRTVVDARGLKKRTIDRVILNPPPRRRRALSREGLDRSLYVARRKIDERLFAYLRVGLSRATHRVAVLAHKVN